MHSRNKLRGSQQNSTGERLMRGNEGTEEKPLELLAGREGETIFNSTEQMETSAHEWKDSKISFHAIVGGGNKDWCCLIILAVSSANDTLAKQDNLCHC